MPHDTHESTVLEATDFPDVSPRAPVMYFGMLIYFDKVKSAKQYRKTMARIALNIGGLVDEYPLSFGEVLAVNNWRNYHETLTFMISARSFSIKWPPTMLAQLRRWANETVLESHILE